MKDEVEEFLRRVAQMRAEAQAKGRTAPPQQPKPASPRLPKAPLAPTPPPRLVPALPPSIAPPMQAEIIDAELSDTADRFSQRLRDDLRGTDQIAEHTRHLGEDVDAADNKMQAHLHQVFDHKLGRLKSSS